MSAHAHRPAAVPIDREPPRFFEVALAEVRPGQRIHLPSGRRARVVGAAIAGGLRRGIRESRNASVRMMEVRLENGETFCVSGSIRVLEIPESPAVVQ